MLNRTSRPRAAVVGAVIAILIALAFGGGITVAIAFLQDRGAKIF